jgi:hypothetical protein
MADFDDKWFRDAKRKAGVTNAEIGARRGRDHTVISKLASGSQPMTADWAQVLSEALNVPLATVMEKTGMVDARGAQQLAAGFSDGDAAPYVPGPGLAEGAQVRTVAQALGQRPGVDVWRVRGRAMMLAGLLDGDFILVDTHAADRVKPGDVVVAQVYTPRGATTVLRRFLPPALVAASVEVQDQAVHIVDGVNVLIRGKVVASWRVA